jgi:hypothetical protein
MPKTIVTYILVFTLALSGFLIGMGAAIANFSDGQSKLSVTAEYYVQANQLVNDQFQELFIFFESLNVDSDDYLKSISEKLSPPATNLPTSDLQAYCSTNLSSSCLQFKLTTLYLAYSTAMQNSILDTSPNSARFYTEQEKVIREINKLAVEFYRQVVFSYPLHIQNKKIFQNLKVLLNNLKDLEDNLKPYSNLFHNATTDACI